MSADERLSAHADLERRVDTITRPGYLSARQGMYRRQLLVGEIRARVQHGSDLDQH